MWLSISFAVVVCLFLFLRTQANTDESIAEGQVLNFGPTITLWTAMKGYMRFPISWLLFVACIAAWLARIAVGQWSWWDAGLVTLIVLSWPLQEWFVHAQLEHLKAITIFGRPFELMITRTHRVHHMNPWDPALGLSPPFIMVLYFLGLPLLCYMLSPLPLAVTATALTLTMVLNYEWVHYLIHTSYPPKSRFYRRLWRNHRLHHFKNEEFWFGLTMLSGDSVMGTNPPMEQAPNSPTCRTLGAEVVRGKWVQL